MVPISNIKIRASYPNYYMICKFAHEGETVFNRNVGDVENKLLGNKPGTVLYQVENDATIYEIPPRWYDMYHLMRCHGDDKKNFLSQLIMNSRAEEGIQMGWYSAQEYADAVEKLKQHRADFRKECQEYVASHPLVDDELLVTTLSSGEYTDEEISHKGHMLLNLTRDGYPVPDFVILTAQAFNHPDRLPEMLNQAIDDMEVMSRQKLGDAERPLVLALRCAMPQYIPGLMPTILNIGVTQTTYRALQHIYGNAMANRVYLSTLHTLCEMTGDEKKYGKNDIELTETLQLERIHMLEQTIINQSDDGRRLITDARYQALRTAYFVREFYTNNTDLILTFMQGKQASPSFILQRMVWTIGNNESYPGVLYSRHSRTGRGRQIESYRNIFGEEIMTGDVTTIDTAYSNRSQIKDDFPAVFHFDPLLPYLEGRYQMPVTIEFAVESRPNKISLFSVLQLNQSEMTGNAALISAIDMYNAGLIKKDRVVDLIKPYHLRQIVSASISDKSINKLQYFGHGLSVLPRTAISAKLCFSIGQAREQKAHDFAVCLCQDRFVPEDTITLNEVDAILSIEPAAIHVVTACRGYGIPAMMDLQTYGIRREGNSLVNDQGIVINELEYITISSKQQTIFKGFADYKPARFTRYLEGKPVTIADDEQEMFRTMKESYLQYQEIITSERATYITDINKLARLIRMDLKDKTETARGIVNNWYTDNPDLYVEQVLESKMGSHLDQSRVFDLLSNQRKVDFFHRVSTVCITEHRTGLKAGSFMLGRFTARPLAIKVWKSLSDLTIAFLLNEYVLYEKYLQVLEDVGEMKIARAHSRIETEGIDNTIINNFDIINFAPLLYADPQWDKIVASLAKIDHQENTHLLLEKLSRPKEEILELDKPWKRSQVEDLLKGLE